MIATTRGTLLRGTPTTDALGDEHDDNAGEIGHFEHDVWIVDKPSAVVQVGGRDDFPLSLVEKTRREFDEASNAWRTVRYFSGRTAGNVPAKAGDRIRDLRDGRLYLISEVEVMPRGLSGRSSVTLTMKRTAP